MIQTRCKLKVESREENPDFGSTTVVLRAQYDSDPESENHRFWKSTPVAQLSITVSKEARTSLDGFEVGKFFYVDLIPAE